jgi:hypothetical protein
MNRLRWRWGRIGYDKELSLLIGALGGRVEYCGGWLYSVRVFLLVVRVEINWDTATQQPDVTCG